MGQTEEIGNKWQRAIAAFAEPERRAVLASFFKTGEGEYDEGDVFIGVRVPNVRAASKAFAEVPFETFEQMLASEVHEFRLGALLALVMRYKSQKGDDAARAATVDFYLRHLDSANNWDLIDLSAPYILGGELLHAPVETREILLHQYQSRTLWRQRAAVVASLLPIRSEILDYALEICRQSMKHEHDLMRKATGWVLREIGKKSREALDTFLTENIASLSSITLSYALEKHSPEERRQWREERKNAIAARNGALQ